MTISRGSEVKFRDGTGIVFTMYSFTASILYFSCAEMGTIGEDSATVPCWMVSNWTKASRRKGRMIQTFHESRNLFLMFQSLSFLDEIDLVLENDDVFEFHDFYSGKML